MEEKRATLRHHVLKSATIAFDGGGISCRVRNLSETGAALDVDSPIGIPEQFDLVIESDHVHRRSRVVWRKPKRIGVTFI